MPGRHSTGPLGGGFRGGGSSGGFSGGSFGGSGWGGGWRPSGPWNPRPGGFGGGWGSTLLGLGSLLGLSQLFGGARFGRGGGGGGCGGCGCGGMGCLIFLCLFFVCIISGGFASFGGGNNYGYPYAGAASNPVNVNNGGGLVGLAAEPPPVQTQTAKDLRELHQALDANIAKWRSSLANNEYHKTTGPDAGLVNDNNVKEVDYGKCGSALYVYVINLAKPDGVPADADGYAYTEASSVGACHPPVWTVYDSEDVGGNWYFVQLNTATDPNLGR